MEYERNCGNEKQKSFVEKNVAGLLLGLIFTHKIWVNYDLNSKLIFYVELFKFGGSSATTFSFGSSK